MFVGIEKLYLPNKIFFLLFSDALFTLACRLQVAYSTYYFKVVTHLLGCSGYDTKLYFPILEFGEYGILFHDHYSQVRSEPE